MVSVSLHLGDCLEVMRTLPDGCVDAVVTDPPYGMGQLNRFGSRDKAAAALPYTPIIGDDRLFDPSPFLQYPIVILFGANWYADKLPASGGWLVWDKKDGGRSDNFSDGEMAWVKGSNVVRIIHHKWRGMIRASEQHEPRVHITQKPVWIMKWILREYTRPGDTILDPFMGSGTTGVACVKTGRNFIGVEIDPHYFAIAQKRIEQAQMQLPLLELA
jgi:site-specific DNA-methyltransferase (adenine-specific)/modification methylase